MGSVRFEPRFCCTAFGRQRTGSSLFFLLMWGWYFCRSLIELWRLLSAISDFGKDRVWPCSENQNRKWVRLSSWHNHQWRALQNICLTWFPESTSTGMKVFQRWEECPWTYRYPSNITQRALAEHPSDSCLRNVNLAWWETRPRSAPESRTSWAIGPSFPIYSCAFAVEHPFLAILTLTACCYHHSSAVA